MLGDSTRGFPGVLAYRLRSGLSGRGLNPGRGGQAGHALQVTEDKLDRLEALIGWARQHGVTVLDVAVGGLAALPGCSSVIAGATSPEQVKANAAAAAWIPSADELADLDRIVPGPAPSA